MFTSDLTAHTAKSFRDRQRSAVHVIRALVNPFNWCLVEQAITNLARLLSVTAERIRLHDDLTARIIDGVNDACGSPLMRGHGCIMHLGRVCPTGYPSA